MTTRGVFRASPSEPLIVGKEPRAPAYRSRETPSRAAASSPPRGSPPSFRNTQPMPAEMPVESLALHPTTTSSCLASAARARKDSSRLCSRIRAIASRSSARHSPRVLPCPLAPGSSALFYRPPTRADLFRSQHIVLAESTTYVSDLAAASYTMDREGIALVFIRNCFVVGQPHRPVSDPRPLAPGYR